MFFPFDVGKLYTKRNIFKIIGIPEDTKGGNWATGYCRYSDDWFIFCNIDTAGRTGHDYANQWVGEDLFWFGKLSSHVRQDSIKSMIGPIGNVYIFVRNNNDAPFIFMGCGKPKTVIDTTPVVVLWKLLDPSEIATDSASSFVNTMVQGLGAIYSTQNPLVKVLQKAESKLQVIGAFAASDTQDARERIVAAIVRRRGQPEFRKILLGAYENQCAISRTDMPDALEAAHITPYRGQLTNHPTNGLLLRADIHTLFDLGHVAVDSSNFKILVGSALIDTEYEELSGKQLYLPKNATFQPSIEALDIHRTWAGL